MSSADKSLQGLGSILFSDVMVVVEVEDEEAKVADDT